MMETRVPCFECDDGFYNAVFKDYESERKDGTIITIPHIKHMICDKCGDVCFDGEAGKAIDDYLDYHIESRKARKNADEEEQP